METSNRLHETSTERISFVKKEDSLFMVGKTTSGKEIGFVMGNEARIVCVDPESIIDPEDQEATKMVFYCNFGISMRMMDFIENYEILCDLELTNYRQQLSAYPLIGFDYEKLFNMFTDLVTEFNL